MYVVSLTGSSGLSYTVASVSGSRTEVRFAVGTGDTVGVGDAVVVFGTGVGSACGLDGRLMTVTTTMAIAATSATPAMAPPISQFLRLPADGLGGGLPYGMPLGGVPGWWKGAGGSNPGRPPGGGG